MYNSKGLNIEALKQHQTATGGLLGFAGAERELVAAQATELFGAPCDILVPAALEKQVGYWSRLLLSLVDVHLLRYVMQINMHNAGIIKAKIIAEGANGPVTPFAQVCGCAA